MNSGKLGIQSSEQHYNKSTNKNTQDKLAKSRKEHGTICSNELTGGEFLGVKTSLPAMLLPLLIVIPAASAELKMFWAHPKEVIFALLHLVH